MSLDTAGHAGNRSRSGRGRWWDDNCAHRTGGAQARPSAASAVELVRTCSHLRSGCLRVPRFGALVFLSLTMFASYGYVPVADRADVRLCAHLAP